MSKVLSMVSISEVDGKFVVTQETHNSPKVLTQTFDTHSEALRFIGTNHIGAADLVKRIEEIFSKEREIPAITVPNNGSVH